jgi:hypothetical protein
VRRPKRFRVALSVGGRVLRSRLPGAIAFYVIGVGQGRSVHATPIPCARQAITAPRGGTVFYISPTGSYANSGTSPCAPVQTLSRVHETALQPGDIVAFSQGGQTFTTPLSPWLANGTAARPITYASYGSRQANLTHGIFLKSSSYIDITHLDITSLTSPAIFTAGIVPGEDTGGSGVTHVVVADDTISDSYDGGVGGYGSGLTNALDGNWVITHNLIENTPDSGVIP